MKKIKGRTREQWANIIDSIRMQQNVRMECYMATREEWIELYAELDALKIASDAIMQRGAFEVRQKSLIEKTKDIFTRS